MEPKIQLDPMTETALRSLHDIAVPPPVSWLPQTWGWAALAALLAIAVLAVFLVWLRRYRRNAYRREALRLLDGIEADIRNPERREKGVHELSELLKRTALAAWPRSDVAALTGRAWLKRMDSRGTDDALTRLLDDLEYHDGAAIAALPPDSANELMLDSRRWIRRHHVSA
ncbi:DUF4381 domain-containing protein [Rhizobium viscosum]|uniref:DUF4381 domain-containing protein n=1 Tax=Rhizobium viscosum TaxID=1673 RepID=A0ABR9IQU9_RHIVS|nr:DUF4381 domain-containing protein [Rhizobium viscosum]MBE1505544.1 hypothetical protein [Rhizobium viscosum]